MAEWKMDVSKDVLEEQKKIKTHSKRRIDQYYTVHPN
jgi:hypothetical protein